MVEIVVLIALVPFAVVPWLMVARLYWRTGRR